MSNPTFDVHYRKPCGPSHAIEWHQAAGPLNQGDADVLLDVLHARGWRCNVRIVCQECRRSSDEAASTAEALAGAVTDGWQVDEDGIYCDKCARQVASDYPPEPGWRWEGGR